MINQFKKTELETLNIRVVGSSELTYYWTIQIDDSGCVEIAATVFGEQKPEQLISIDPREAIKIGEQMIICAREELEKQKF